MPAYRLTNKAVDDLRSIARYTEKAWGREQRNKYLSKLDSSFQMLVHEPELGRACDEIRQGYRKIKSEPQHFPYLAHGQSLRRHGTSSDQVNDVIRAVPYRLVEG